MKNRWLYELKEWLIFLFGKGVIVLWMVVFFIAWILVCGFQSLLDVIPLLILTIGSSNHLLMFWLGLKLVLESIPVLFMKFVRTSRILQISVSPLIALEASVSWKTNYVIVYLNIIKKYELFTRFLFLIYRNALLWNFLVFKKVINGFNLRSLLKTKKF